jgi:uncharacterized LabA/DUF88 family protein
LTGNSPEEQRIALFIDFENIAIGVRDAHYRRFDINLVLERLVEKGKILTKRAYADWGRYGEYRRSFHEAAVELIEVPQKSVGGKNSADIRLVVDAMDMSFQKEHIDCFCIASGDSDFSPLVSKLKENDKYVIGLGVKNSTSDLLMENCDEFIFYEDLVRRQEKPAVVIPNIPDKLQEAFAILVDSVVALQLENKGVLWGSMVKETMKRKKPSFNETYYGFRSFSNLLEDAQRRGVVNLRRDQKSGSYIIEDLGAAARGEGAIAPVVRASEPDASSAAASAPDAAPSAAPNGSLSNGSSNGHANGNGYRNGGDRERRPALTVPPQVPAATIGAATIEETQGADAEGGDDDSPMRSRRRRGGRGRRGGRDRDNARREGFNRPGSAPGERDGSPDLEARAEEIPLPALDEDSNPSIPTVPEAAAAYAEMLDRTAATSAPVFVSAGPVTSSPAVFESTDAKTEQMERPVFVPPTVTANSGPIVKPTPPVTPVEASKASFSLLGWLKGGG